MRLKKSVIILNASQVKQGIEWNWSLTSVFWSPSEVKRGTTHFNKVFLKPKRSEHMPQPPMWSQRLSSSNLHINHIEILWKSRLCSVGLGGGISAFLTGFQVTTIIQKTNQATDVTLPDTRKSDSSVCSRGGGSLTMWLVVTFQQSRCYMAQGTQNRRRWSQLPVHPCLKF